MTRPFCIALLLGMWALCPAHLLAQPLGERMSLRGRVLSRAGQPAARTVVIVRRPLDTIGAAFWGGVAVSDARGDFVLENAEEGDYEIGGETSGLFAAVDSFVPYRLARNSPPARVTIGVPIRLGLQVLAPDGKRVAGQTLLLASAQKRAGGGTHFEYLSVDAPLQTLDLTLAPDARLFVSCFAVGWGFVDCGGLAEGSSVQKSLTLSKGGTLRLEAREPGSGRPILGAVSNIRTPDESHFRADGIDATGAKQGGASHDRIGDIANLFHWESRQRGFSTGEDGSLTITNVRPGFYLVNLSHDGFDEPAFQLVRIEEGKTTACTVDLKPRPR